MHQKLRVLIAKTSIIMDFKQLSFTAILVASLITPGYAAEPNKSSEHDEAVTALLAVTNLHQLTIDSIDQLANQLPADKRVAFQKLARNSVKADTIEQIAFEQFASQFTTEELKALTEFRSTPIGQSITEKLSRFDHQLTARIKQQIAKTITELVSKRKATENTP